MNLIIDVGNTLIKLAVFDTFELKEQVKCEPGEFLETLARLQKEFKIKNCILSTVGSFPAEYSQILKEEFQLMLLDNFTAVPFSNQYGTPATLGVDRIALAAAAVKKYPDRDVLVIDAGSCITYDIITKKGDYLGGTISPGIRMRYKALNTFTANLPLLEPVANFVETGNSTEESIHSGVLQAVVFEIQGFIASYKQKYPHLTVILTGGDAQYLLDSLKSDIFANSNFLLEGLNYILEHNKH